MRHAKALVERVGLAAVLLGYPGRQAVLVFFDDFHGTIGGASVDDEILHVRIVLLQHRQDGGFQKTGLVE